MRAVRTRFQEQGKRASAHREHDYDGLDFLKEAAASGVDFKAMAGNADAVLTVHADGPTATIQLRGDWDVAHVDELKLVASGLADRDLIFDLLEMTFIDSTIITALINAKKSAESNGRSVYVKLPQTGMIRRVFELMRLETVFHLIA